MKILYIWVNNYKCFNKAEMNFYGNPRFHFNFAKKQLVTINSTNNLFPLNDNSCIENVSAIVGTNGSGKTSICSLLYDIEFYHSHDFSYIFICSMDNQIYLETDMRFDDIDISNIPFNIQPSNKSFSYNFNILYYSPYYDADHKFSCYGSGSALFKDLSTSNLMEEDLQEYKNPRPDTEYKNIYDVDRVTAHETLDNIRIISFLAEYDNFHPDDFNLNITLPKYIRFSADENQFKKFEAECHDHNSFLFKCYSLLKSNLDNSKSKNAIIERIMLSMFCNFSTTYLLSNKVGFENDIVKEFLARIEKGSRNNRYSVITTLQNIFMELSRIENITNFKDLINNEKASARLDFINLINNLGNNYFINDSIQFDLSSKIDKSNIISFLNIYNHIEGTTTFIKVSYKPIMSSGEKSEIQLYARLKYGIDKLINEQKTEETLLFLDEIEITLHPKLQQNLVENLILFLHKFYKNMKFQIILSTHSPIILSDLPSSNVVFLEKSAGLSNTMVKERAKQTFASNIYQLFNDSFFLDSTPIGDFARKLIQSAIDEINDCYEKPEKKVSENTKKIVSLIGEPVFRNILEARIQK